MGYRFRLHSSALPGKPDLVFPRLQKVMFVNGCFWHGHGGCKKAALPKSNVVFWKQKIDRNRERDRKTASALRRGGWRALVIWQCALKDRVRLESRLRRFLEG
jgi:DNA mismatch endonuclease (patch repair protein)